MSLTRDGRPVLLRPVAAADEPALLAFMQALSPGGSWRPVSDALARRCERAPYGVSLHARTGQVPPRARPVG